MTRLHADHDSESALLDAAVAAVLAEEIPPGPPSVVHDRLVERRLPSQVGRAGRRRMSRATSVGLAATVVLCGLLAWQLLGNPGNIALADVAREFHRARNIQFRSVGYVHERGEGGEGDPAPVWRHVSWTEHNYRAPGLYRMVNFDADGVPWQIVTEDASRGLKLELRLSEKKAILTDESCAAPFQAHREFPSALRQIEEMLERGKVRKELGTREIDGRRVVGLRVWTEAENEEADFWIDRKTRQIVRYQNPTAEVYDPETDPASHGPVPPGSKTVGTEMKGSIVTDIVYDAPLDVAQYVLTPPEDYRLEQTRSRMPTEKDLLEWLEVFAQVRGGTFTDDVNSPYSDPVLGEKLWKKSEAEQTEWERTLQRGYVRQEEVSLWGSGRSVLVGFWTMYRGSWHYQGKGVRLGDARTPICWYRPADAADYRVVYGDLSVRDVPADKLPNRR